ncbi:MAG: glycosyltransferase family 2 protein [Actinomycetota bacterium]|nr:glycosyltransferase family 2 protein [Actinomycetota bacterium]
MSGLDTVLVAYRSEDVIEAAVRAARELGGQVVVVDHGDGGSARTGAALGAVTFEDRSNPGFGAGQNRGVATTTSPFVLLCNPDAVVVPQAVAEGAKLLEGRPDVAAVQGVIVNRHTGLPERSQGVEIRPAHLLGRALGGRRLLRCGVVRSLMRRSATLADHVERVPRGPVEVESLAATAVLIRRSAFEEVGGFDPSFFLYGEDLDLCHRLRLAGWKLMAVPEVWAHHLGGASAESSRAREVQWWRGTLRFANRWWGPRAWSVAITAATVRWARLAVTSPRGAGSVLRAMVIAPARARRYPRLPWTSRRAPTTAT